MNTGPRHAASRLKGFVERFEPAHRVLIRRARTVLRTRFPAANELVYDNYNFLVIGYGPTERPSECFVSIAAGASGVSLCFIRGARLRDPKRVLLGSGKQTRFVRLRTAEVIELPEISDLLAAAAADTGIPLSAKGRGRLILRSVSRVQRPRRKPRA